METYLHDYAAVTQTLKLGTSWSQIWVSGHQPVSNDNPFNLQ